MDTPQPPDLPPPPPSAPPVNIDYSNPHRKDRPPLNPFTLSAIMISISFQIIVLVLIFLLPFMGGNLPGFMMCFDVFISVLYWAVAPVVIENTRDHCSWWEFIILAFGYPLLILVVVVGFFLMTFYHRS